MAKWWILTLVLLAALGAGFFTLLYQPQQAEITAVRAEADQNAAEAARLGDALDAATGENGTLKSRVADLESLYEEMRQASENLQATKATLEAAKNDLEAKLAAKEAELAALNATHDELVGELTQEIKKGQIEITRFRDKLRVDLVDEILFASGEAEITTGGQEVLRKVGGVLQGVTGRLIEVQGHTDNVQIVGRLKERYDTNWELSAARAVNVVRYLQDTAGVDPTKLSAVAFSEYQPKASNDTDLGKQQNRRIEILLSPVLALPEE